MGLLDTIGRFSVLVRTLLPRSLAFKFEVTGIRILRRCHQQQVFFGKRQSDVIAGVIYFLAVQYNIPLRQNDIARACETSPSSLRKHYDKLKDIFAAART